MPAQTLQVDVHLEPDATARALRADVLRGLTASPKWLPPKWFYDEHGSRLFDEITRLDEYYPTRREREILVARAPEIVAASGAATLVELGSGTSEKTRLLLDAMSAAGSLERFIPFDISEAPLLEAAEAVLAAYPGTAVHAIVGDFEHHLGTIPTGGTRMIAFLGGTIGNLVPDERARFLADLSSTMRPGDSLLLGTDLVKDVGRLIDAYDDARGVTAAFNKNVLNVLNRELDGDFNLDRFAHVALWDAQNEWIEMRLRSLTEQTAHIRALDLELRFDEHEEIRTEISAKFRPDVVEAELARAGLAITQWWTDPHSDFALSLSFKRD